MENLIIRLGSNRKDPVHWLVWSGQEKEIIASGILDDADQLASLTERAGKRPITALVPGCDFYLKWVTLPAKASRKALTAIPYMLEEELSSDVNEQFFALGERLGDQQSVAVVSHSKMQDWLDWIADAGLHCDKLLPDVLAVPHHQDAWSVLALEQQIIVRQDLWQGLQGDSSWIFPAIEHYAKQQTQSLVIANYSDVELGHLANINMQQQPIELPMQLLATGAMNTPFNLLQGQFKVKKQNTGQWQKWRLAAILAAIALLVSLVDKGIELHQLDQQKQSLRAQMQAEYKRAFPNSPDARLIRQQMERKLAELESGGGSASMLVMLDQLANAFAQSKVKPQTMRFDSARNELRLSAVANDFEALEMFKRLAREVGFDVEQGAINNRENQVIGSLTVRS